MINVNIEKFPKEDYFLVNLEGRFDKNDEEELKKLIINIKNENFKNCIINANGIHYLTSSGIKCFIEIINYFKKSNGLVIFCNFNKFAIKILNILHIDDIFILARDIKEAKEIIKKQSN